MTALGWAAFGCYALGAVLAGAGIALAFREAQAVGRALDELKTAQMPGPGPTGAQPVPLGQVNQYNTMHVLKVALAMAGNKTYRWVAFILILTGAAVELAGNLLSLPW